MHGACRSFPSTETSLQTTRPHHHHPPTPPPEENCELSLAVGSRTETLLCRRRQYLPDLAEEGRDPWHPSPPRRQLRHLRFADSIPGACSVPPAFRRGRERGQPSTHEMRQAPKICANKSSGNGAACTLARAPRASGTLSGVSKAKDARALSQQVTPPEPLLTLH